MHDRAQQHLRVFAAYAERLHNSTATRRLVTTHLTYLQHAQRPDGTFSNFMRYDRTQIADLLAELRVVA